MKVYEECDRYMWPVGHPAGARGGETKEPTSGQSHPVMSSAQTFMKITPALDAEKIPFTYV